MIQHELVNLYPTSKHCWKQQEANMKKYILIITLLVFPLISHADRDWRQHANKRIDHHFWRTVDQRLDRQYRRIENGIHNGDLTRREASKLHRQHHKLDKRIERIQRKQPLVDRDKRKIMSHLDRASDNIYRLKHNKQIVNRNSQFHMNRRDKHHPAAWSSHDRTVGFYVGF